MQSIAPTVVAQALTRTSGLGAVRDLQRLAGGRNNRVFRVETDSGPAVMKLYHADPRDPRDRLGQEWAFLTYAWGKGVRAIPQPLAHDPAAHAGLYGFLAGRKLLPGDVFAAHVDAALEFVLQVNAPPRRIEAMPAASEARFSLADHLATIEGRVARLGSLDPEAPEGAAAEAFVRDRLQPAWRAVKDRVIAGAETLDLALKAPIEADTACLSPSDFGFHNALADGPGLSFIDFEYAGRDDPAKLACDFCCQPEVPVPASLHEAFIERLVAGLGLAPVHAARCRLLLDAYRVKWACIVLNDFLPLGAARRAFADQERTPERCRAQLARAANSLAQIPIPV